MTPPKVRPPVPAIALAEPEAAGALSMSPTFFREHVMPDVRSVRVAGRVLYPVTELERWTIENAEPILPGGRKPVA